MSNPTGGVHVTIAVYKPTGKWYTESEVRSDKDVPIYDPEFKKFILKNLPAHYDGGFVVVRSCDDDPGFHNVLYVYRKGCLS